MHLDRQCDVFCYKSFEHKSLSYPKGLRLPELHLVEYHQHIHNKLFYPQERYMFIHYLQ